MRLNDTLRDEYRNFESVLPDAVIAPPPSRQTASTYHRADHDGGTPYCNTNGDDWQRVNARRARLSDLQPCRLCFEAVFYHFAQDPDTAVEWVPEEKRPKPAPDGGPLPAPKLSEIPTTVVAGSDKFHAPDLSDESEPRCDSTPSRSRSVAYNAIATHYDPCRRCFAEDAQPIIEIKR